MAHSHKELGHGFYGEAKREGELQQYSHVEWQAHFVEVRHQRAVDDDEDTQTNLVEFAREQARQAALQVRGDRRDRGSQGAGCGHGEQTDLPGHAPA